MTKERRRKTETTNYSCSHQVTAQLLYMRCVNITATAYVCALESPCISLCATIVLLFDAFAATVTLQHRDNGFVGQPSRRRKRRQTVLCAQEGVRATRYEQPHQGRGATTLQHAALSLHDAEKQQVNSV